MIEVTAPAAQFFDLNGDPLDMGRIYIGVSGQNPETNPQAVFWDFAGTIPAAQPIETRDGYPYRDGAAAKFYTNAANYSITVRNKRGELVVSSLDTNSGVFDELQAPTGAGNVGYNNTSSGLAATNVQDGIDELEQEIDNLAASFSEGSSGVINLFGNSIFNQNRRGYVSGTPTVGPNEFTIDLISVVVTGQSLTFTSSTFGNRITAPAGGADQIIPANTIVGGDYACTWVGSGTIEVNGVATPKNSTFSLPANTAATIRMFGQFEQFMLTRPNMIGVFEFEPLLDLNRCRQIVETGSNANGRYVRFADGTQVCWHSINLGSTVAQGAGTYASPYQTAPQSWTFPAVFSAAPSVQATGWGAGTASFNRVFPIGFSGISTTTLSDIRAHKITSDATSTSATVELMAIGRWF